MILAEIEILGIVAIAFFSCLVVGWIGLWTFVGTQIGGKSGHGEFGGAVGFLIASAHVVLVMANLMKGIFENPNH